MRNATYRSMKNTTVLKLFMCIVLLLCGCGYPNKPKKTESQKDIPMAIQKHMGSDRVYYFESNSDTPEGMNSFFVEENPLKEDLLPQSIFFANESISDNELNGNIKLAFWALPGDHLECFAAVTNISKDEGNNDDRLECLSIYGISWIKNDSAKNYNDLNVYKNIDGIKHLVVTNFIQTLADEKGIDWYEWWPELEDVTVME